MISCLVIIDVQNGFLTNETNNVPDRIKELLSREKFDHIVATKYMNHEGSPCYKQLNWTSLMTKESQALDKYVESISERVFEKDTYSCFTDEFKEYLKKENITDLHFVGIDTDCCVLGSLYDAFDAGYNYKVYLDCCASCGGKKQHDSAVVVMERVFGKQHLITK